MRRYELMLLFRPDLEDDKLQAAVEKVTRAIVNAGGSLSKVSPWGKRRLAYDINRHREASYFLIHFDIEPSQVREIERGMLISEEILRHLVTVLEDRGPIDELAPAAAARSLDEDGEPLEAGAEGEDFDDTSDDSSDTSDDESSDGDAAGEQNDGADAVDPAAADGAAEAGTAEEQGPDEERAEG